MVEKTIRKVGEQMSEDKLLELLIINAYNFYSNTLIKNYDYFCNFNEGDLIMETTTISVKQYHKNRIGYLKRKVSDSECVILTLDGREFHWENANFIRVQEKLFELR